MRCHGCDTKRSRGAAVLGPPTIALFVRRAFVASRSAQNRGNTKDLTVKLSVACMLADGRRQLRGCLALIVAKAACPKSPVKLPSSRAVNGNEWYCVSHVLHTVLMPRSTSRMGSDDIIMTSPAAQHRGHRCSKPCRQACQRAGIQLSRSFSSNAMNAERPDSRRSRANHAEVDLQQPRPRQRWPASQARRCSCQSIEPVADSLKLSLEYVLLKLIQTR